MGRTFRFSSLFHPFIRSLFFEPLTSRMMKPTTVALESFDSDDDEAHDDEGGNIREGDEGDDIHEGNGGGDIQDDNEDRPCWALLRLLVPLAAAMIERGLCETMRQRC
jgi:hypothetical protein